MELSGVKPKAGTRVLLSWISANRDGEMFDCPNEFMPDRAKLPNMSASALAHTAASVPRLAQIEGQMALIAMFTRFRKFAISLRNDFEYDTSRTAMRNLRALHLELEAA